MLAKLKIVISYALILAAGLGAGYVVAHFKEWTKSPYTEGNYATHFPDAKTKVVMYGTSTCPYCKAAREYFVSKNIVFSDFDVNENKQANAAFMGLKNDGGVPAIIIGDRLITGFDKVAIEDALKKAQLVQ